MPRPKVTLQVSPNLPIIIRPGSHSGDSGQSGSDHEHSSSSSKKITPSTATPNRVRRRSRAARRSTGITPTEADLDTPDKVNEMAEIMGVPDPLLTLTQGSQSLQVPEAHNYQRAPKVAPKPSPSSLASLERIAKLTKEIETERRKREENDCQLFRDLEELRRKDLNIRALEKTQQRLKSTVSQLETDITKLKSVQSDNDKITEENASLIRVIGKLSKKASKIH